MKKLAYRKIYAEAYEMAEKEIPGFVDDLVKLAKWGDPGMEADFSDQDRLVAERRRMQDEMARTQQPQAPQQPQQPQQPRAPQEPQPQKRPRRSKPQGNPVGGGAPKKPGMLGRMWGSKLGKAGILGLGAAGIGALAYGAHHLIGSGDEQEAGPQPEAPQYAPNQYF